MSDIACRAVAQAGMASATASLDGERPEPLMLVAGWLSTAADTALSAAALAELEAALAA